MRSSAVNKPDVERGRLVQCYSPDGCDQWYWEGPQERPHLMRFPTRCRVHNPAPVQQFTVDALSAWVAETEFLE